MVATTTRENLNITIDKEFAELNPPICPDERAGLRASLTANGCIDSIIVWDQGMRLVLLDGHNRYEWCQETGASFRVRKLEFDSRHEARNWIIRHQLGRRNITSEQRHYLIGRLYLEHKPDRGEHASSAKVADDEKLSAGDVARQQGVSERTVHNAANRAEALDAIGEKSPDLKSAVLAGQAKASTSELKKLANSPKSRVSAVAKKVRAGNKRAIKEAAREPGDDTEAVKATKKADAAARRANGKEVISATERKDAMAGFRKVRQLLNKLGGVDYCKAELEIILAALEGNG